MSLTEKDKVIYAALKAVLDEDFGPQSALSDEELFLQETIMNEIEETMPEKHNEEQRNV